LEPPIAQANDKLFPRTTRCCGGLGPAARIFCERLRHFYSIEVR